jgi:alanyl-tRNA synthetase
MSGEASADLRNLVGDIRGRLGPDPAVVALIAEGDNGTVPYVIAVNPAAVELGVRADELVKQFSGAVDGRGGGKAELAQGSGKDAAEIETALSALRAEIARS